MDSKEATPGGYTPRPIEALFDVLREGVALCQVIRDDKNQVVDYWIRQANSAFLRGLGGKKALGQRMRELRPDVSARWYEMWGHILAAGHPTRFEYHDPRANRWYDVHCTPLSHDEIVMLYVDVTHRKQVEAHLAHLLNELNHRVKNNLTMVTSMLAMQARASEQPEVKRELQQAIDRIQSISEVHTILYKTGAVETVRFDSYLSELCGRLSEASTDRQINIELQAAPLEIGSDQAVQMGIVVNELITNALKYAYPAGAEGRILVRLESNDGGVKLAVRDFGEGSPEAALTSSSGLGMRLVRALMEKDGGVVEVRCEEGTEVRVTLPAPGGEGRAGGRSRPP